MWIMRNQNNWFSFSKSKRESRGKFGLSDVKGRQQDFGEITEINDKVKSFQYFRRAYRQLTKF